MCAWYLFNSSYSQTPPHNTILLQTAPLPNPPQDVEEVVEAVQAEVAESAPVMEVENTTEVQLCTLWLTGAPFTNMV